MINKAHLAGDYALNVRLIKMQTTELTHADSLMQTPYNINCLNWLWGISWLIGIESYIY